MSMAIDCLYAYRISGSCTRAPALFGGTRVRVATRIPVVLLIHTDEKTVSIERP